jgi:RNA polymerase sigma-70 factor (ECF subfamily)
VAYAGAEFPDDDAARRRALSAAMDRHADGDDAAFGEVYDLLSPRLLAYFTRHLRDRARAEDLVQQTLLNMHRARANFCRGADVLPWAFAIARRLLIDTQRRARHQAYVEIAPEVAADVAAPDEVVATQQLAERLAQELARLSEPQRTAWSLVRDEGLSMAQAAEVLGTSIGAVKLRAHRAYEALRTVLGEPGAETKRSRSR